MVTHNKGDYILMTEGRGDEETNGVLLRILQPLDLSIVNKLDTPRKFKEMDSLIEWLIGLGFVEDIEYSHIDSGPLDHIDLESIAYQSKRSAK